MKEALARLFSSVKVWTAIIGMLATAGASLLARYGLELSDAAIQQTAITVASMFAILLGAQGAADFGKEKAKIEASVTTTTTVTPATPTDPPSIVESKEPTEVSVEVHS